MRATSLLVVMLGGAHALVAAGRTPAAGCAVSQARSASVVAIEPAAFDPAVIGGVVTVGGGAFFLKQSLDEKARAAEEAEELRRYEELQAMKRRDNAAGVLSMGIPAAGSVLAFGWFITNF